MHNIYTNEPQRTSHIFLILLSNKSFELNFFAYNTHHRIPTLIIWFCMINQNKVLKIPFYSFFNKIMLYRKLCGVWISHRIKIIE